MFTRSVNVEERSIVECFQVVVREEKTGAEEAGFSFN